MALTQSPHMIHATSVAIGGRAVLLHGPSGAGKSDLALRLIDRGARLVSDDYTLLTPADGRLMADAPATIAGKMEVRGLGVIDMPPAGETPVALIAELAGPVERLPDEGLSRSLAGIDVPLLHIAALEPSAPIKVELALKALANI